MHERLNEIMALINCPECNKEISDKAAACIGCGCPITLNQNMNNAPPFKTASEPGSMESSLPNNSSLPESDENRNVTYKPQATPIPPPFSEPKTEATHTSYTAAASNPVILDDIIAVCGSDRARALTLYREATGLGYPEALLIVNNAYDIKYPLSNPVDTPKPFSARTYGYSTSNGIKIAKLICGIISIVVFMIIVFQSCAAGLVNVLESNDDTSGTAGVFLAVSMLIAGIIGIATRNNKGGGITAGAFYLVGGIIAFASLGTFTDLIVWSVLSMLFSMLFLVGSVEKKSSKIIWAVLIIIICIIAIAAQSTTENSEPIISDSSPTTLVPNKEKTFGDLIEFDDLEIVFWNDIEWTIVSNQFSDKDGMDVFLVSMTIKNTKEETHGLNMFYYTRYGSQGTKLDDVGTFFDGEVGLVGNMRSGASQETFMAFLYDGDGDYHVEFSTMFGDVIEVVIPINK